MIIVFLLLFMAGQVPAPAPELPTASDWRNDRAAAGYVMEATGRATDPGGAMVTLRAPAKGAADGLSTANGNFSLPDGAMILLTTAIEVDRTGRRYGGKVDPDEEHPAAGSDCDPAMSAASAWLKNVSACSQR